MRVCLKHIAQLNWFLNEPEHDGWCGNRSTEQFSLSEWHSLAVSYI